MLISTIVVTEFMTNCFIFGDAQTKESIVIDPGGEPEKILSEINRLGVNITAIINTHAHIDHIGANKAVKDATKAEIYLHENELPVLKFASRMGMLFGIKVEQPPSPDKFLKEGDEIKVGKHTLKVLETPGHSPGGISLVTDDGKLCFAGDTLFNCSIGRTDLPGGDYNTLISSIKKKIMPLTDDTKVMAGHGPATTVGNERKHNPFL